MKPKIFSTIKFFIGWPLSLLALFFIGRIVFVNFKKILPFLSHINISLLLISFFCFFVYFLFRSYFWHTILKFKGVRNSFLQTTYLWEVSEIKRYIPGNVWAIAGRTAAFAKNDVSQKSILKLWFLEMEFLIFATSLVSLVSVPFIFNTFLPDNFTDNVLRIGSYILVLALIGLFLFSKYLIQLISRLKIAVIAHIFPPFTIIQNVLLLTIMSLAYVCFGLGTFISIYAIFQLPLSQVALLSSFLVFSYLIGYIAIISPMGLGIREAIMTAGLSKYLILAEAGFSSIFSRVILIIAEMFFFLFVVIFEKIVSNEK